MSVETAIWKMTDDGPVRLSYARLDLEARLEDMIVADPMMVGLDVLVVGRQVSTAHGGFADVLAVDGDGQVHVIELKRDRTPRDVVAQTLDYGSWVTGLTLDEVAGIFTEQHDGTMFEDAFAERFAQPLPDVFNADQQLTIVASELDPASDRIVEYLAERFGVPINAVFFRHFSDGPSEYLTRTWLMAPDEESTAPARAKRRSSKVRPWNGRDFYVIQGTNLSERDNRWEIARRYGVLTAGGGSWYWKPLRNLTPGKRVFAYVGKVGYVGVGVVAGPMQPARDLQVDVGGRQVSLAEAPDVGEWCTGRAVSTDEEVTEFAVPVRWEVAVGADEAVSEPGLFASQVTVCKLRDDRTIELVEQRFGLTADPVVGRDWSDLHELLERVPAGRWTTYGDLAEQIGSAAIAVGQHVASCPGCRAPWRVLGSDRKAREGFRWEDPDRTETAADVLASEGVVLDEYGRADAAQRMQWAATA